MVEHKQKMQLRGVLEVKVLFSRARTRRDPRFTLWTFWHKHMVLSHVFGGRKFLQTRNTLVGTDLIRLIALGLIVSMSVSRHMAFLLWIHWKDILLFHCLGITAIIYRKDMTLWLGLQILHSHAVQSAPMGNRILLLNKFLRRGWGMKTKCNWYLSGICYFPQKGKAKLVPFAVFLYGAISINKSGDKSLFYGTSIHLWIPAIIFFFQLHELSAQHFPCRLS